MLSDRFQLHRHRPAGAALPGPRGRGLGGNLEAYEADRLGFLLTVRDQFGGLAAFDRRTTIISDPLLARQVLRDRTGTFEIRENFLQRRLALHEVDETTRTRRLLSPGLRRTAVAGIGRDVAALTRRAFNALEAPAWFDPVPVTEDVISRAVASHYFGADGRGLPAQASSLLDALGEVIGNPFALPAAWNSPVRRRIAARHRGLRTRVLRLLEDRATQPGAFNDFASDVVARGDAATQPLERIADLLIGSMLAAQRVPAAAASWMLMLIADHAVTAGPLQVEAARFDAVCAEGLDPDPRTFPTALGVVLETLRLFPATWLLTRSASREAELGGHQFARGHNFLISPYVIHRDPTEFEAATQFVPDRWTGIAPTTSAAYLPFGWGRHACPGADLATNALVAIALSVAQRWEIRRMPSVVTPDPRTTLLPRGLRLQITARQIPDRLPAAAAAM